MESHPTRYDAAFKTKINNNKENINSYKTVDKNKGNLIEIQGNSSGTVYKDSVMSIVTEYFGSSLEIKIEFSEENDQVSNVKKQKKFCSQTCLQSNISKRKYMSRKGEKTLIEDIFG